MSGRLIREYIRYVIVHIEVSGQKHLSVCRLSCIGHYCGKHLEKYFTFEAICTNSEIYRMLEINDTKMDCIML